MSALLRLEPLAWVSHAGPPCLLWVGDLWTLL